MGDVMLRVEARAALSPMMISEAPYCTLEHRGRTSDQNAKPRCPVLRSHPGEFMRILVRPPHSVRPRADHASCAESGFEQPANSLLYTFVHLFSDVQCGESCFPQGTTRNAPAVPTHVARYQRITRMTRRSRKCHRRWQENRQMEVLSR